jgi:hypothetical protein
MPDTAMNRCQTKRMYKTNGVKETRWVDVDVLDVVNDERAQIRCSHCHGALKFDKGREYVMHRLRADADNCQNGRGPQGAEGLSSKPVS